MMEPSSRKKKKGGRPSKAVTKKVIIAVRLSQAEHFVLREKAQRAGVSRSDYLRQTALSGTIKNRLSEEERYIVRQLVGMANNLNQVARCCHEEGVLKAMLYFEQYRNQIDEILKKIHHV